MKYKLHVYVRRHRNDWYSVSLLGHEEFTVYGPDLTAARRDLAAAISEAFHDGELPPADDEPANDYRRRVLELEIRAVQHERLIRVPMRFTVLDREISKHADSFEVWIPRISERFAICGEANIEPWASEVIRGRFHMVAVSSLLKFDFERGERLETLEVNYNAHRHRKRNQSRASGVVDPDERARRRQLADDVGQLLNTDAQRGRLPRAWHRQRELSQLVRLVAAPGQPSVLLEGPSGVGKTALVHELVQQIVEQRVPARLQDTEVWHISGAQFIAGMRFLGEWQQRCKQVVEELRRRRGILYAGSLLELMTTGGDGQGNSVARYLLTHIRNAELCVLVEASPEALAQAEQLDPSIVAAFRRLPMQALDPDATLRVLRAASRGYEKRHRVRYTSEVFARALDLVARFSGGAAQPGAGLALLERVARVPGVATPGTPEKAPRERDGEGRVELRPADVITAFSRASGFPETLIDVDRHLDLDGVRTYFSERIVGQPRAVALCCQLVALIKASLNDPSRPIASYLFMGPTGVGKTETAACLAEYLFGDRKRVLRFDMSEYGFPGAAGRLIEGVDGQGDLSRRVREQPFSLVLLDEIEKAAPEVFDVLLQVLGEGRLTDATGSTVHFDRCIIIMTSNLGVGDGPGIGMLTDSAAQGDARFVRAAKAFFKPEFVNRIDHLVPFAALDVGSIRQIAARMLDAALQREGLARREIRVSYDGSVLDALVEAGFDARYGARPMKRAIDARVLAPLARRVSAGGQRQVQPEALELYVDDGQVLWWSSQTPAAFVPPELDEKPSGPQLRAWHTAWRERLRVWHESRALANERRSTERDRSAALTGLMGVLEKMLSDLVQERDWRGDAEWLQTINAQLCDLETALQEMSSADRGSAQRTADSTPSTR